jgi:hypothetical protein
VASEKSEKPALRLLRDFDYLLDCARGLETRCEREIAIIMRTASIAETRSALKLSAQPYRWAVLVAVYMPFSFTSTLLGMNFVEFGNVGTGVWAWFIITIPLFTASLALISWDVWMTRLVRRWKLVIGRFLSG